MPCLLCTKLAQRQLAPPAIPETRQELWAGSSMAGEGPFLAASLLDSAVKGMYVAIIIIIY